VTGSPGPTLRTASLTGVAALLVALALVGAGGISGGAPSKASLTHTCQAVDAVLANGPDPDVDPVGYALAQILPLRRINTGDKALKRSIQRLSSAYETFYKADGSPAARTFVETAAKSLNAYCPGAVS
jgi:hypothetical protein